MCTCLRYSSGVNPIGIATTCIGDLCPQDIKIVTDMGSLSVGDFYDWSSASAMPDMAFAIKFTIVNGQYRVTVTVTTLLVTHMTTVSIYRGIVYYLSNGLSFDMYMCVLQNCIISGCKNTTLVLALYLTQCYMI